MAVSGTGDWPLRSRRAHRPPGHRKQLQFGLEGGRSTLLVDLFFGTPAGGTVYNENINETVTLSEALAGLAVFSPAVAETVTLSEAVGTSAIFSPGVAESVSLAEAIGNLAIYAPSLAETLTLVEALLEQLLREYPTPGARTFFASDEARALVTAFLLRETLRTMATGQQARTLYPTTDDRQAEANAEGRTFYVGAESRTELAEGE